VDTAYGDKGLTIESLYKIVKKIKAEEVLWTRGDSAPRKPSGVLL
jgi:hypothetical protein